ncbi:MAG: MarR family transcriptional regulator [Candidatus Thorarchaeota archaeon]
MSSKIAYSALLILDVLNNHGPMPPRAISKKANVPLRTVSFALKQLRSLNLCKRVPNLSDMRQPLYVVDSDKARSVFMRYGRILA